MEPDQQPAPPPPAWRPGKPLAVAGMVLAGAVFVVGLVVSATGWVRTSAAQADSANKLKQLGLGFQNFDSAQGSLPPHATRDEAGRKLVVWRVAVMPYVECSNTFPGVRYNREQPWDSEHNRAEIPSIAGPFMASGTDPSAGLTPYQAFDGEHTPLAIAAGGSKYARLRGKWSVAELAATHRGTSGILFVVEAGPPTIWTHPDGLPYSPDQPPAAMEPIHRRGFLVLMADGAVKFVRADTPEAVWRAHIDPASTSDALFE